MPKAVMDALASSTAHGIGRIVTTNSTAMKVMWSLLFLTFLGLFLKTGVTLVTRFREDKLTKSFELDKVAFEFPDLYFCPNNPYSGSYPFALSPDAAALVNAEVERLSSEFDRRFPTNRDINLKARLVQNSLPVQLQLRYMAQQRLQAVQQCSGTPMAGPPPRFVMMPRVVPFSHPENLVCFLLKLTDRDRAKVVADNWQLNVRLSTDPYFADFDYSGFYSVEPIRTADRQAPFQDWSPRHGTERLQETGFTMLIVPAGTYPSLVHETKFSLAPSNAYSVQLSMEETAFSEELHGTHCYEGERTAAFKDYLTGEQVTFGYSSAACHYAQLVERLTAQHGCLPANFPLAWHLRNTSLCLNMTETPADILDRMQAVKPNWRAVEKAARDTCRRLQPCRHRKYSASFSFSRWPSVGSSIVSHFAELSPRWATPAVKQLINMAETLSYGNHTAHIEGAFRSYVSESLISVSVSARRSRSPQVLISPAYSLTAFLADTGGLLGLYIGCSLLTMCELLELLYRLAVGAAAASCRRRRRRRGEQQPGSGGDANDSAERQAGNHEASERMLAAVDGGGAAAELSAV